MNHWKPTVAILMALSGSLALANDFKTINGKEYKNATVTRVEADGIVVRTKRGISKLYFVELPDDVQARFGHDPAKIEAEAATARAAEEKRIEAEAATASAAEEKRIEEQKSAERERVEIEKNADADLKRPLQKPERALVGEWKGTDPSGQTASLVLNSDRSFKFLMDNLVIDGSMFGAKTVWRTDMSRDPMTLDLVITPSSAERSVVVLTAIFRFVTDQKIQIRTSKDKQSRPTGFSVDDTETQMVLTKQ